MILCNLTRKAVLGAACLATAFGVTPCRAQESSPTSLLDINAEVRVDWQLDQLDNHTRDSNTGFAAKYFMLRFDGRIAPGLTYSVRERFSKLLKDPSFWDATDWVYLNYEYKKWNFRAGKDVVAIGGWEYDRNPVDIFAGSIFWNNISCYQLGVSAGYNFTPDDRLTAQVVQSPFFTSQNRNLYSYNIMWSGHHGCFRPLWSANLVEYDKGRYISYLALGNRFEFGDVYLEADFMNRATGSQQYLFADCSVMAEAGWHFNPKWTVQAKFTYDVNSTHGNGDALVKSGTEMKMIGADVEYWPLTKDRHKLRLHAGCWYAWGRNADSAELWQDNTLFASVGITWMMNYFVNKKK